jgi:hypothetical protein
MKFTPDGRAPEESISRISESAVQVFSLIDRIFIAGDSGKQAFPRSGNIFVLQTKADGILCR